MRTRNDCITVIAILSLLVVSSVATAQTNVVLFVVDDMGWTDWQFDAALNPTGSAVYETPNMLRLGKSGVVFDNAYASSPVCSPTRAALMTGNSPARTRISDYISGTNNSTKNLQQPDWVKNLAASEVTLAESLTAANYATGFFGKWHLGESGASADPLQNGFQTNVGGGTFGNPGGKNGGFFAGSDGMWAGMPKLDTPNAYPPEKYLSDALDEQAVSYIESHSKSPFFLMMSHYLVHTPIQAPQNLVKKYTQKIAALRSCGVDLKDHTNPTYAAMVEKMDDSLGVLLDRLEDPNGDGNDSDRIRKNTVIFFVSDNGGLWSSEGSPTCNLPLREGKGSVYEGGIRTPAIVSWTGNAAVDKGLVSEARFASHDLYPTILEVAEVLGSPDAPQNSDIDGVSIVAAIEGKQFDRGYQFWHYPHISPQDQHSETISGGTYVSAIRHGDWKLIFFYDDRHYELYNLATDLGETKNVLKENPQVSKELSNALHQYLRRVNAQMPISKETQAPVDYPTVL